MGMAVKSYMNPEWFTIHPSPVGGQIGVAGLKSEYLKEAQQAMKDLVAQRRTEDISASKSFDVNPDVPLTKDQLTYLKENYDPRNMTQEQYDSFVKDLEQFGAFSGVDSTLVGAGCGPQLIPLEYCMGAGTCSATSLGTTLDSCDGNALEWVKYRASFRTADPTTGKFYRNHQALLFSKLENVMRRMEFSA